MQFHEFPTEGSRPSHGAIHMLNSIQRGPGTDLEDPLILFGRKHLNLAGLLAEGALVCLPVLVGLKALEFQICQFSFVVSQAVGFTSGDLNYGKGLKVRAISKTPQRGELQKLYSPSGRALNLVWRSNEDRRLHQILDGAQCLVRFEYDEFHTRIMTTPDTAEARTFKLTVRSGRLDKLKLPAAEGQLCWEFQYNYDGLLWCIDKVDSPSGLGEEIKYREQNGAPPVAHGTQTTLPQHPECPQHAVWPGQGHPPIVTNYRYSDKNFLGYASGFRWTDDGNYLYLLVEPAGALSREKVTYYTKPIGYLDDQPPYYLLPAKVETTYTDRDADHGRPPRTKTNSYQ
ncbi:hypothetical protein BO82DRAFT_407372 [Aspergillus uvarum CBS 121591]|uniref:RHS repeat protein n=1 Tax=Aspergillus uvarum CBS 121591 TaxID=1448315 RepID=A0A319BTX5_9EURO|nr:hypothetical protein BO82DRAFT_407372 [Aspergillus uvarum CBS 121591]PYH76175.1 hypothetical protein BO82DRAFT_407372 [Aspergillus uvarum CBS 121591]